jgi:hypothetical protein
VLQTARSKAEVGICELEGNELGFDDGSFDGSSDGSDVDG